MTVTSGKGADHAPDPEDEAVTGSHNPGPFDPLAQWTFSTLKEYVDARLVDLQGQIDRRIQTQQRELKDATEHVQTLIREGDRLTLEKLASVEQADRERVQMLDLRVAEVDRRLTDHVDAQIGQISAALEAARRETQFAHDASERAVAKSEANFEARLSALNKLREEVISDRAMFVTRDVMEAKFQTLSEKIDRTESVLDVRRGVERRTSQLQPWQLWAAGAALTVVLLVVNVVVAVSLGG